MKKIENKKKKKQLPPHSSVEKERTNSKKTSVDKETTAFVVARKTAPLDRL